MLQPLRPHELALNAGRQLQNAQTGFVHLCYESAEQNTVPLLENTAFALALLRSRKSEQMLEGKALLEKILAFQVGGNFPVYLHHYPRCVDEKMAWKLAPYFFWMVDAFSSVLGPVTKALEPFLEPEVLYAGQRNLESAAPRSIEEWAQFCIAAQMAGQEELLQRAAEKWNERLCLYVGEGALVQEKGEPAVSLFDFMMGQWTGAFPKRCQAFHPLQIRASLIQPAHVKARQEPFIQTPFYIAWGGAKQLHSFAVARQNLRFEKEEIWLPEEVPEEGEKSYEIAFYVNVHPDNQIFFGGKKASAFTLQEPLCIQSNAFTLRLQLDPRQGKGQLFGHLMRGNRPGQLMKNDAYDWKIAIRTIWREKVCSLRLQLALDYREPLPSHGAHYLHTESSP
jgi:hypothetical protein